MTSTNETISEMVRNEGAEAIQALIIQWINCAEAYVDDHSDIWVADPMTGHWLDDEKKAEFVAWAAHR